MNQKSVRRPSLFWPLSILLFGMLVIMLSLGHTIEPPPATLQAQEDYPANEDPTETTYPSPSASRTRTHTSVPTTVEEDTSTRTHTLTPKSEDEDTPPTQTNTATATADADEAFELNEGDEPSSTTTSTATDTNTPTATDEAEDTTPSITPTYTPTYTPTSLTDDDPLLCLPDVPVIIEGTGPPNKVLLLYFKDRVIGGTTTDARGFYRLTLVMGKEKPGEYLLELKQRGNYHELVRQLVCRVPEPPGTPAP